MKPNQEFINMIVMLYQTGRQTTVSYNDLILHRDNATYFYPILEVTIKNSSIVKKTEPFSDIKLIVIDKGANNTNIMTETSETVYTRVSPLEFTVLQGTGMLYWLVKDEYGQMFEFVKIMSDDGDVLLKVIKDDESQLMYNVCQLPQSIPKDITSLLTQTR